MKTWLLGMACAVSAAQCLALQHEAALSPVPEQAFEQQQTVSSISAAHGSGVCVTAHPLATEACTGVLLQGGSAADAAVAAAWVLGLVEPQSSGPGGGGYAVYFDGQTTWSLDGRETAPLSTKADQFLTNKQTPMSFKEAVLSEHSVGVAGMPALMHELNSRFGELPWASLLTRAQSLASTGFRVTPRLASSVAATPELSSASAAYLFYPHSKPLEVNQLYKNPGYAKLMRELAKHPESFYSGAVAQTLVSELNQEQVNLSLTDLSSYQVKVTQALCRSLPPAFGQAAAQTQVCVNPPSSSGGVALLQILQSLNAQSVSELKSADPKRYAQGLTKLTNAQALAFADRGAWLGDSDFYPAPLDLLLSRHYLNTRQQLASQDKALSQDKVSPGFSNLKVLPTADTPNTSHLSVVDSKGRAVSMTLSVESAFGSKRASTDYGFVWNNQLTDFDFTPSPTKTPKPNQAAPLKRPRSSMTPVLVLENGHFKGALGSPGGSRIIGFVTQALVELLAGVPAAEVVQSKHVLRRFEFTEAESGTSDALLDQLQTRGHKLKTSPMASGLAVIWATPNGLEAAADPRREGTAKAVTTH